MIERVETGKVQIGDDWPAVLIRGDHALHFAMTLQNYLANPSDDFMAKAVLKGLADTLSGANARNGVEPVKLTRADLAQAPAPVRVKKMVWEAFGEECLRAETVLGRYEIMWGFHNGQTSLDVPAPRRTHAWHTTPEAAKTAAQADYEARVLAALESPDAGVAAELVEALRLADAALSGANMNMDAVEKKVKAALALIAHNTTEG